MTVTGACDPSGPQPGRYPGPVPFYRDRVVPRLVAMTCGAMGPAGLRARTAAGLGGRVVESLTRAVEGRS